tara:strand:+ start:40457 stop:40618 length:162 start_codon:yes stop_codon:yes gene_type:complete
VVLSENTNKIPIAYIFTNNNLYINSKDEYRTGTVSVKGGRLTTNFHTTEIKIR